MRGRPPGLLQLQRMLLLPRRQLPGAAAEAAGRRQPRRRHLIRPRVGQSWCPSPRGTRAIAAIAAGGPGASISRRRAPPRRQRTGDAAVAGAVVVAVVVIAAAATQLVQKLRQKGGREGGDDE